MAVAWRGRLLDDWRIMDGGAVLQGLPDFCRWRPLRPATEMSSAGRVQSYIQSLGGMPGGWASEQKAGVCSPLDVL